MLFLARFILLSKPWRTSNLDIHHGVCRSDSQVNHGLLHYVRYAIAYLTGLIKRLLYFCL